MLLFCLDQVSIVNVRGLLSTAFFGKMSYIGTCSEVTLFPAFGENVSKLPFCSSLVKIKSMTEMRKVLQDIEAKIPAVRDRL